MSKQTFSAKDFPVLYAAYQPHLPTMFPNKETVSVADLTAYLSHQANEYKYKIDSAVYFKISNVILRALVPYVPDAAYYNGQLHFKHKSDYDAVMLLVSKSD